MNRQFLQYQMARCSVVVVLVGLAWTPNQLLAQEKGAERLLKLMRPPAAPMDQPAGPKTVSMSCPKCKDVVKQVPDWSAKGAQLLVSKGRPAKSVVQHLCEGCSTTWTTVGHGKAKQQVAQHVCTHCGADTKSCCATVANGKPAPGM